MTAAHRACALAALVLLLAAPVAIAAPGDLDPAFGDGDGTVVLSPAAGADLGSLALQGDLIVTAGRVRSHDEECSFGGHLLMRLFGDGTPDPAFGTDGVAINRFGDCNAAVRSVTAPNAMTIAPDGRIYTTVRDILLPREVGNAYVSAHTPTGAFDTSFAGSGFVVEPGLGEGVFSGLVRLDDGRLLAVGYDTSPDSDSWQARRYLPDGSPDPSFGGDGAVVYPHLFAGFSRERADAVTEDGDAVVVAGESNGESGQPASARSATIGRILSDGSLDPAFGDGGRVRLPYPDEETSAHDVVRTSDGGFVMAGRSSRWSQTDSKPIFTSLLLKVDATGALDESFGDAGRVDGPAGLATEIELDPEGRLLVAGVEAGRLYVARYLADGTLDPSFGDGGIARLPGVPDVGSGYPLEDLVVQPDGNILVGSTHADADRRVSMRIVRLQGDPPSPGEDDGTGETEGEIGDPPEEIGDGTPVNETTPPPAPERGSSRIGRVSIRILSSRINRRGVLVRVTWPRGTDGRARARLWTRDRSMLLGKRSVRARPTRMGRTFRAPLNRRARQLLADGERLKVVASVRVTGLPAR